jgi:hypothetical protein
MFAGLTVCASETHRTIGATRLVPSGGRGGRKRQIGPHQVAEVCKKNESRSTFGQERDTPPVIWEAKHVERVNWFIPI